jgi:hypothetical protein
MIVGLMTLVVCATAGATDVLYSTLGPNGEYDTGNGYFVDGSNYFNQVLALPFTPNKSENVADAVLAMGNYAGNNSAVNVFLESDNGGQPGSILASFSQQGTIPPFSSGGGLVTYGNCTGACGVNTSTQYWIVAQETDPATEQVWMWAYQDQTGTGAFNQLGSATGPWNVFDSTIDGFRVDGSSVPEPGTLVMLGSGVLAVAAGIRRKFGV